MRSKRRRTYGVYPSIKTGGTAGGRKRKNPRQPKISKISKIVKDTRTDMSPGDRARIINKQLPWGTMRKKNTNKLRAVNPYYKYSKTPKTKTMVIPKGKTLMNGKLVTTTDIDFSKVSKDLKRRQRLPRAYKLGPAKVVPIAPIPGGNVKIPKAEAFMETETVSAAGRPTAGGLIGKVQHAKHIQSGKPTSSTLKRLAKNNGTHKAVMFDTKFDNLRNADYNHSHGFNCKTFWFPPAASFPNLADLEREIGSSSLGVIRSSRAEETFYASVLNVKQMITLHNQNVSLPMKVKVHWVRMDDRRFGLNPVQRLATAMFQANISGPQEELSLRENVPQAYQFSNLERLGPTDDENLRGYEVQTSMKLNPFVSAPAFKTQFSHIRTVSKVLQPGDTWSVNLTNHCGSGINLEELRTTTLSIPAASTNQALQPVSYMPVIETHGFTVEGVQIGPTGGQSNFTYLGSAPGWWKAELKKEITYVKAAQEVQFLTDVVADRSNCHLRVFTKDDSYLRGQNEVFGLPGQIGDDQQTTAGNWYIPVVRDHEISHASPRHSAADNSTDD